MKKTIFIFVLLVLSLFLMGCTSKEPATTNNDLGSPSNGAAQTQSQTTVPAQQNNWKADLKVNIEAIDSTGLPKVSTISESDDNVLSIEYSTWNVSDTTVFDEQQKIAEVLVNYFVVDAPKTIKLRALPSNDWSGAQIYNSTLSWSNIQSMAKIEFSKTDWGINNIIVPSHPVPDNNS